MPSAKMLAVFTMLVATPLVAQEKDQLCNDIQRRPMRVPDLYFGLLRATMKDGSTMVLTGRGADAKSSITETPRSMD
jgi:hypothetical protein